MKTRMGTTVTSVHSVGADGWCVCELDFGDDAGISTREIHIGDLRFDNTSEAVDMDRRMSEAAKSATAEIED